MPESGNTKLLQVLSRQARQDPFLNLVLAEGPLVPFEAKPPEADIRLCCNICRNGPLAEVAQGWKVNRLVVEFCCRAIVGYAIIRPLIILAASPNSGRKRSTMSGTVATLAIQVRLMHPTTSSPA
jgi:hypothetical protein